MGGSPLPGGDRRRPRPHGIQRAGLHLTVFTYDTGRDGSRGSAWATQPCPPLQGWREVARGRTHTDALFSAGGGHLAPCPLRPGVSHSQT